MAFHLNNIATQKKETEVCFRANFYTIQKNRIQKIHILELNVAQDSC